MRRYRRGISRGSEGKWNITGLTRQGKGTVKTHREARFHRIILKQIHSDIRLSLLSSDVLVSLTRDLLKRLFTLGVELMAQSGKSILKARDIQVACRLLFKGELAKHAVSEGMRAVQKCEVEVKPKTFMTILPSYVKSWLIKTSPYKLKVSKVTYVYAAAVVEYISAEVLELSGNLARDMKSKFIQPKSIASAIACDDELSRLFSHICIPQSGNPSPSPFNQSLAKASSFNFGSPQPPPTPSTSGFSFGGPQPTTPFSSTSGFSGFASTQPTPFNFGPTPTTSTQTGVISGIGTSQTTPANGFSFGTSFAKAPLKKKMPKN